VETSREQTIIDSFITMADNLVADFDVVDLLTGLADRCVAVFGVSAVGVMFASPTEKLRLVASSSEAMRVVELFELQAQEGPCFDAYRTGQRVGHEMLQTDSNRWPRFSQVALDAGFVWVLALPLRLRETIIGALNLFGASEPNMDEHDIMIAQGFADLATISVLQHGAAVESQRINDQLTQALTSRIVIEQAKGVVAERASTDIPEAFRRLRSYARSRSLRLADVAEAAINDTLDPAAWAAPTPPGL
jgi:hypothetical protein